MPRRPGCLEELLYIGAGVAAWWRPPSQARVYFHCEEKRLGTCSAITPQPGLVFARAGAGWYVYAVKGTARPAADTPLFRAPYFNVNVHGLICEGNLERPAEVTAETLAAFERGFFDSRFTHPNMHGPREMTTLKGGAYALWKALLAGRWQTFPEKYLVSDRHTVSQRLTDLEGRHGH